MEEEKRIQWHSGFCAAVQLEFLDEKDMLIYEVEHTLNSKPLQVDLLVVKKNRDVTISKPLGAIFKGHNLMEFKSPKDHMDIDSFFKVIGYACLYKSYGRTVDEIKTEDITITFVRDIKPKKLFSQLEKKYGCMINKVSAGVYHVDKTAYFLTQIIVTDELSPDENVWLHSLTDDVDERTVKRLIKSVESISVKGEKNLADSVLEVVMRSNKKAFDKVRREDRSMNKALLEMMRPEMEEEINQAVKQAVNQAVSQAVNQAVNQKTEEILKDNINKLAKDYLARGIAKSEEEALQLATALLS